MDLSEIRTSITGKRDGERSEKSSGDFRIDDVGPDFRGTRASRMRALTLAIETAVIPRMVELHRAKRGWDANWVPSARQLEDFTALLLDRDDALASAYIEDLLDAGTPFDRVHTKLMADAARRLGAMWDSDEADFAEVTMGLLRMHRMLYLLEERFSHNDFQQDSASGQFARALQTRRILLMPALGEQHSFGLAMVAQFFRRAGWEVMSEQPSTEAAMADLLTSSWFDVVGISLGAEERLPALSTTISRMRKASRNPHLWVMVGGPVFVAQPERFREIGADVTAVDAAQAIIEAKSLMSLQAEAG